MNEEKKAKTVILRFFSEYMNRIPNFSEVFYDGVRRKIVVTPSYQLAFLRWYHKRPAYGGEGALFFDL